jgi:isoleucyl-tRNA synthetase
MIAGERLASDEVEIHASPRPGTIVAHDVGLVVVLDTEMTSDLRAEGDSRDLQRAIQDLRKEAGLAVDDRIDLWVDGLSPAAAVHLESVAAEVLADSVTKGPAPDGATTSTSVVPLDGGPARIALRRRATGG